MKNIFISIIIIQPFISSDLFAQKDYNKFYKNSDPACDTINPTVKLSLHKEFLKNALWDGDTIKIILGNLYLANDYFIQADYTLTMKHLIHAEKLVTAKKDTLLLGRINHKKGAVYSVFRNYEESIKYYKIALEQNRIVKDSQYLAITIEQLGCKYANIRDFDKSNEYYEIAIPMVEKYWNSKSMIVTLINYGNSLDDQGYSDKAIQVYKRAIKIGEKIEDEYEIYSAKINLALVYENNDSLNIAIKLYKECIEVFKRNAWLDFLVSAYSGISSTYEKMKIIDSSYHYLQKHHFLRDSVVGAKVQNQVSQLETNAKMLKMDMEVLRQKEIALRNQQKFINTIVGTLILLLISTWIIGYFFQKAKKEKLRLLESRKSLKELSNLLALKNAKLRDLTLAIKEQPSDSTEMKVEQTLDNVNFYEMTILTDLDWEIFKGSFERSYPKYIQNIRIQFPDISPAEDKVICFD